MLYRKLNVARATRVIAVEILLIMGFVSGVWFVATIVRPALVPAFRPNLIYGVWFVGALFLGMVSYATSFQVTPLALLFMILPIPSLRRHIKRQRLFTWISLPDSDDAESLHVTEEPSGSGVATSAEREMRIQRDKAQDLLKRTCFSANTLANRMERRTNTYLILGIAMGFVGLTVWYFSISHMQGGGGTKDVLLQLVPRLTILVFIELLAGFFLQQYRVGVEDFKYFLSLKHKADANRVTYTVLDRIGDEKALKSFANSLVGQIRDMTLAKGQSTSTLEMLKADQNVTLSGMKAVAESLKELTKLIKKESK